MDTKDLQKSRQKSAAFHVDKAADLMLQAAYHLKESKDSYSKGYLMDIDCIADDLAARSRQLLTEDLSIPASTVEAAVRRDKARKALKQYLDMVEREDGLRDD